LVVGWSKKVVQDPLAKAAQESAIPADQVDWDYVIQSAAEHGVEVYLPGHVSLGFRDADRGMYHLVHGRTRIDAHSVRSQCCICDGQSPPLAGAHRTRDGTEPRQGGRINLARCTPTAAKQTANDSALLLGAIAGRYGYWQLSLVARGQQMQTTASGRRGWCWQKSLARLLAPSLFGRHHHLATRRNLAEDKSCHPAKQMYFAASTSGCGDGQCLPGRWALPHHSRSPQDSD
jgi:hypothetical protein